MNTTRSLSIHDINVCMLKRICVEKYILYYGVSPIAAKACALTGLQKSKGRATLQKQVKTDHLNAVHVCS